MPVLERRCAVCHGCYDAPCQLLLTSTAGLDRGASKRLVYASARLRAARPTRLFVDEKSTEGWRRRDFFSVLEGSAPGATDSLLLRMLSLGLAHSFAAGERLPDSFPLDISRSLTCPTLDAGTIDLVMADAPPTLPSSALTVASSYGRTPLGRG